jgi:glutathione peroxidase
MRVAAMRTDGRGGGDVYSIGVTSWDGAPMRMDAFRGRVMLIVNVASQCGFTPQYAGLEALYRKYQDRGFVVLGFPCNQFGRQEPAGESEIHQFCEEKYNVTFPLFAKIDVNGEGAHPLFVFLKAQKPGVLGSGSIKWNFTKFLVDRSGRIVARFGSRTTPDAIEPHIVKLLD